MFLVAVTPSTTTTIYTLSLLDALPISRRRSSRGATPRSWPRERPDHPHLLRHHGAVQPRDVAHLGDRHAVQDGRRARHPDERHRSEEHTSELQSLAYLVCRLLLEKKKL